MSEKGVYPKFKMLKPNAYYQGLLQNLYASNDSEMSSFLQFSYQSFVLLPFGSEAGKVFSKIADEELLHARFLSQAIVYLGGDPVFCNTQGKWLGGRCVDYVKDLKQMVAIDIENKEKSLIDYKTAMSKIEDKDIKLLIEDILKDEESHYITLKRLLKSE